MELCLEILPHLSTLEAKVMHKADDSVCVRQAITPRGLYAQAETGTRCPYLRTLRIRLGTDPAGDAATLASALWGRKRGATSLYLYICSQDLAALEDRAYVAKLRKAFNHCTRHAASQTCTLILIPKDALAVAS